MGDHEDFTDPFTSSSRRLTMADRLRDGTRARRGLMQFRLEVGDYRGGELDGRTRDGGA